MIWKYNHPKFEYEDKFQDYNWPWAGHKLFGYDLVLNLMPEKIVELGTHKGTSFFSFCQAVKDSGKKTSLYAVDTWKGDKHAGFYDDSVFMEVSEIKDFFYRDINAELLKMTFDEAVNKFEDYSIDILHIDGLHTYEAVKHDFENWFMKVKKDGIILFHDSNNNEYEVINFWNELKKKYKTMQFDHSGGLGVLFKDSNKYSKLALFFEPWKKHYPLLKKNINKVNPKVSVIIPVYNHGKFISKAIQSVLDQTYQNFEIVITNDGSTDNTLEEINKFDDSRIKIYCFDKNQGVGMAMNNCIKHSSGEYIASLNADDIFEPEKLSKQVRYLEENKNVSAVFSYANIIDDDGKAIDHQFFNIFQQQNRSRFEWLHRFFYEGNCLCHPSAVLRKSVYEDVGLYDCRFHQLQDFEMWVRICLNSEIHVIPEILVNFRILPNEGNITGNSPEKLNRLNWEFSKVLEHYSDLSMGNFIKIFPEAKNKFGEIINEELINYYVSMIALEKKPCYFQYFAINALYNLMKNEKIVSKLRRDYKFNYSSFVKLTGSSDFFNFLHF